MKHSPPESGKDEQNSSDERSEIDDGRHEVEKLWTDLQEPKAEIQTLRETVSSLQTRVDQSKDCIKLMWYSNHRYIL